MYCERIATKTNKADSMLFDTIYNSIAKNEQEADSIYAYFQSKDFLDKFGDWISDYGMSSPTFIDRLDDNFEPKLFFDNENKKHYFLDKNNNKVYFPLSNNGLTSLYSHKYISGITSQLAFAYFDKNFKNDFNNIDFTDSKGENLKSFITNTIKEKIDELKQGSVLQKVNANTLEKSLQHVDEWVNNVDKFFKQLKLERNDNEEELEDSEDLTVQEEDTKDPSFTTSSFEKSTKESISSNIKLRLSLLKDFDNLDIVWKAPTFIKFDDVYGTLLSKLPNKVPIMKDGVYEDIFDLYLEDIQKLSKSKPYFNQLYQYLKDADNKVKSEFTQAFNLHRNRFLNSEFKIEHDKENDVYTFNYSIRDVSNVGSKEKIILSEWGNNFQKQFLTDNNILKEGVIKDIEKVYNNLEDLRKSLSEANKLEDGKYEAIDKAAIKFKDELSKIGVNLTTKGLNYFLNDFDNPTLTVEQKLLTLSNSISQVNEVLKTVKKTYKAIEGNRIKPFKNLFEDQKLFTTLGEAEAFFLTQGTDASIRTGGKNKWLYSYPSYLSTKILSWKKDRSLLEQHYNLKAYNRESVLMEYLLAEDYEGIDESAKIRESNRRLASFDLGIFDTFQSQDNTSDVDSAKDISINDYYTDYVNKLLSKSFVRTTTAADKTTDYQLKSGFGINTNIVYDSSATENESKVIFTGRELDIFFNYFKAEYNRMIEAKSELENFQNDPSKLKVYYHGTIDNPGNAFKSQLFPDLSPNSKTTDPLAQKIKKLIYDGNFPSVNNGKPLNIENEYLKDLISEYIQRELSRGVIETGKTLRQVGIFTITNKDGRNILVNKNIDKSIYERYSTQSNPLIRVAADVYINGLINNIEYSKLFSGDPAYYKNMVDYKKRIPATYTDGLQLRLDNDNLMFKVAIINSIKIDSPFIDKLKETVGENLANKYKSINAADAQAWITPQRWKFLMERLGKFTKAHEEVYNKMMSNEPVEYTEKELKLAAQALKGVYFDINEGVPTYLKYSQAVLTPNLIKGTSLQKIYDAMINQGVDELITLDGMKVGAPTPTKIHNADGSLVDNIKFNVQPLKNSGWKLQQDLPTKTFKDTEVGSQIQKNIFAGLKFNRNKIFDLDGSEVSGEDIINEINQVVTALTNKGWESLQREFDIDKNNKINNIKGFYNAIVDELEKRGGSSNVIEALKKELPLYGIPQAQSKVINVFSSIMTKRLIKIKTNGGSFIQMSNFGLNKSEAEKQGVIWSPTALETTHEPYKDENGKIRPGGILISGSWLAKYIPDYKKYTSEQLFGEIIDEKIYKNLVGYRIPNQGLASNDALEIVGILPEENGDTVVAYTGITTKTGSDKMLMFDPV